MMFHATSQDVHLATCLDCNSLFTDMKCPMCRADKNPVMNIAEYGFTHYDVINSCTKQEHLFEKIEYLMGRKDQSKSSIDYICRLIQNYYPKKIDQINYLCKKNIELISSIKSIKSIQAPQIEGFVELMKILPTKDRFDESIFTELVACQIYLGRLNRIDSQHVLNRFNESIERKIKRLKNYQNSI